MSKDDLSRRSFHRLAAAAIGGVLAGSFAGCPEQADDTGTGTGTGTGTDTGAGTNETNLGSPEEPTLGTPADPAGTEEVSLLMEEPHVCRGLNTCKNMGASKENACAGQGTCATAAEHTCHAANECKGQGGCGEHPGENECKGKGECGVPLSDDAWTTARANFEAAMKAADKTVGDAPAKA